MIENKIQQALLVFTLLMHISTQDEPKKGSLKAQATLHINLTFPHWNPLTPLLNQHSSPSFKSPFFTTPSTTKPFSKAHLLVVPIWPPLAIGGVTHFPSLQKNTVVKLPSIISSPS